MKRRPPSGQGHTKQRPFVTVLLCERALPCHHLQMDMKDRLRAVLMAVVALALGGMLINSLFEEDLDPADYPACSDIVEFPTSSPEALCANDGDVIELQSYSLYEFYR